MIRRADHLPAVRLAPQCCPRWRGVGLVTSGSSLATGWPLGIPQPSGHGQAEDLHEVAEVGDCVVGRAIPVGLRSLIGIEHHGCQAGLALRSQRPRKSALIPSARYPRRQQQHRPAGRGQPGHRGPECPRCGTYPRAATEPADLCLVFTSCSVAERRAESAGRISALGHSLVRYAG